MLENCYDQTDGDWGKMLEELEKENIYRLVEVKKVIDGGNDDINDNSNID